MKTLILLCLPSIVLAGGPKYKYEDARMNDEMDNIYHDIRNTGTDDPLTLGGLTVSTMTASSATITNLSVTNLVGVALGKIKQVVSFSESVEHTTTSNTLQSTTITASITPAATSSKVLILVSVPVGPSTTNEAVTVKRGATDLGQSFGFGILSGNANTNYSIAYVDSPATVASTAYTVFFRNSDNATSVQCGRSSGVSSIVLMEIGI
jgi:hypothetical protein